MRFVGQVSFILLLTTTSFYEQEASSSADNPLATLEDEVKQVLTDARLPFTDDQEKAMTNAFNHANHGTPWGVMTSPKFGFSTNAGEPREIEVGMRFRF